MSLTRRLSRLVPHVLACLRALAALAARAMSPPTCAACDAAVAGAAAFCPTCTASVRLASVSAPAPACPPIVASAAFGGAVAAALRRFKYRSRPDLARPLGRMLRAAASGAELRADLVIPVPLHPRRLAERGYNQAALLAAEAAPALRAAVVARGLARVRDTAHQARLARDGRGANVADAFQARWPERVRGRAVVLVDDVATTGATLAACAEALRRAGAASVVALVVARAGRDAAPEDAPGSDRSPALLER